MTVLTCYKFITYVKKQDKVHKAPRKFEKYFKQALEAYSKLLKITFVNRLNVLSIRAVDKNNNFEIK